MVQCLLKRSQATHAAHDAAMSPHISSNGQLIKQQNKYARVISSNQGNIVSECVLMPPMRWHGPRYCMQQRLIIALHMTVYTPYTFDETHIVPQGSAWCVAVTDMHTSTNLIYQNEVSTWQSKNLIPGLPGRSFPRAMLEFLPPDHSLTTAPLAVPQTSLAVPHTSLPTPYDSVSRPSPYKDTLLLEQPS